MRKSAEVKRAVTAGLEYLAGQQLRGGGFESQSSPSAKPFSPERTYRTNFAPAIILSALAGVPGSDPIRERLAGFLRSQAGRSGAYNYWSRAERERGRRPYPDDLDDTFCALAALHLHDPAMVDARVLAGATRILLATEAKTGGPYRTWLVPDDSRPEWMDVDLAVNANVAYFLHLMGSSLPRLQDFIDGRIAVRRLDSPYYPSPHMTVYYVSRGYTGKRKDDLVDMASGLLKTAREPLETALCLSALCRLRPQTAVEHAADSLLGARNPDGSWPAAAFCLDPAIGGKTYYSGSAALTTALVLEALQLYGHGRSSRAVPAGKSRGDRTVARVLAKATSGLKGLESELREPLTAELGAMADGSNGEEIICLPHRFNDSLIKPLPGSPGRLLDRLGMANLYGWLAYTVYDDVLDGDGRPALLPAANAAARRSLESFLQAVPDTGFAALVRRTFDEIDGANAWEQAHCRFKIEAGDLMTGKLPDHGHMSRLADRSLGHTLAPLGVLGASDLKMDSAQVRHMISALRHYLIVRQLNDDAHDWADDLARGRITPVVAAVLANLKVTAGRHALSELMPEARRQFWHGTLPDMCEIMREHARLCRNALIRSKLLKDDNVVTALLSRLEAAIDEALAARDQAREFLKYYEKRRP